MRRHLRYLLYQATFLAPIIAIVLALLPMNSQTPVAEARVTSSAGFGSAVACLNNPDQFATTQFANTLASPVAGTSSLTSLATLGDSSPGASLANLGSIGSVYGLAYDDGGASGHERLFAAAYTKRFVNYGPAGAGGVYVFEKRNGVWSYQGSFQAASLGGQRPAGSDAAAKPLVGRSALGGMQVSPDGRQLYIMNVQSKRLEVFSLLASGMPTYVRSIPINLGVISGDPAAQADLWPFALKFFPHRDASGNTLLVVGVNDAATRGINPSNQEPLLAGNPRDGVFATPPRAYLLTYTVDTGSWGLSLNQDLGNDVSSVNRAVFETQWVIPRNWTQNEYIVKGWNHWRDNERTMASSGNTVVHPQPLLSDIEFVSENEPTGSPGFAWPVMVLGFRDRTADLVYNGANVPTGEFTTTGHGDSLVYRFSGGMWRVQTTSRQNNAELDPGQPPVMVQANGYDVFNDDLHAFPGLQPAHVENHQGGLASVLSTGTNINGFGVKLATTTLMGGGGAQGVYVYDNKGATGGDPTSAVTLIPTTGTVNHTKAANLGDLEVLCSYALVGGRVWNDANGDGIQGPYTSEPGLPGIALDMRRSSDNMVLSSLKTDGQGQYLFAVPPNTSFQVRVNTASSGSAIAGYHISPQAVPGSSATNNSDADRIGGGIQFRDPASSLLAGELRAPTRISDERTFDVGLTRVQPNGYIGDRIWVDTNGNGVQDAGETNFTALNGAIVTLQAVSSEPGVTTLTAPIMNGVYGFTNVTPGTYRLVFPTPPAGYQVSPQNQGGNDALDSDASATTSTTADITVEEDRQTWWDYGLVGGGDLWVTKSASAPTAIVGTQFTYTLSYGNRTGIAQNATINDTLPAGLTYVSAIPAPTTRSGQALSWSLGQLNAGASGSIRIIVRAPTALTPGMLVQQNVQNCATILAVSTELNPADNSSCANTNLLRPEVNIVKSAPTTAAIGTQFSYTLTYANVGTAPAAGVTVSDTLPAGLSFIAFSANPAPACSYTAATRTVSCPVGTLNPAVSRTVSFTVQVDPTLTGASVANTATITTTSTGDDPTDNTSTVTTTIQRPDVRIVKSAPATVLVGDTFSYTLSYSNIGTAPASNVVVSDPLPAGLSFVAFTANPAPACVYTAATRTVSCPVGTLNPSVSRTLSFTARADASMTGTALLNTAGIGGPGGTPIPGDGNPANDSSTVTTTVQFPDPEVTITIAPRPLALGDPGTITLAYRNSGTGVARAASISATMPPSIPLGTLPGGCAITSTTAAARVVTCSLGDLSPGTVGTRVLPVSLPGSHSFPLDQLDVAAAISSTTPQRAADAADDTDTDSALIVRPNVFVTASGPDTAARVAWGSAFYYDIGYGNLYRARPTQTRAAQNSVLRVTLPDDVTFLTASVSPSTTAGQVLTWDLGTLSPQQVGSLRVAVKTSAPSGATLTMLAHISTTTAGDDPGDNQASVTTVVVPPPTDIPTSTSDMRLAIRSTLDPNSNDADATNGVYLSSGPSIAWPAGEVLDFTPRLSSFSLSDPGWPFEHRARLIGWSIERFSVNGRNIDPRAADARGLAGCRAGAAPAIAPQSLMGCAYAYVGASTTGRKPADFLPTAALREADLDSQAHTYWTQPPTPPMRNDVYLHTLDPLAPVQMTLAIEVEEWLVNSCPNFLLDPLAPCAGTEQEMPTPGRKRELVTQTFTVTLLVPRSVVGPGDRSSTMHP